MRKKSKVRQPGFGGCLGYGFFGVFATVGSVACYFLTWGPIATLWEARSWEETTCVVLTSEVAVSDDGDTYGVDVRYTYEDPSGEIRHGDRYDFNFGTSSGYEAKARVVQAHPPGSEVTCYVDPKDPSRAVIDRSPGLFLVWGLFPLPFLAVGLGGLLFLAASKGGEPRAKAAGRGRRRAVHGTAAAGGPGVAAEPGFDGGPLRLEAEASPAVRALGLGCFALVWNGILSIPLFAVILPSFRRGDPEWFGAIVMIPFVLVGLAMIGAVFHHVLAWFNPRPRLTLEGRLTPGAQGGLTWDFSGLSGRIERLTIELEGREEARYRRGTNTFTEHHVFFSRHLVSEEGRLSAIHRRTATLEIPRRTMPSFEAPNNKIEWRLKVHGDVPFWPDVDEAFPIVVHPRGDARW